MVSLRKRRLRARSDGATSYLRWTRQEEEALLAGVRKHGFGRWRAILLDPAFADALKSRTNIDAKDKWRTKSFVHVRVPQAELAHPGNLKRRQRRSYAAQRLSKRIRMKAVTIGASSAARHTPATEPSAPQGCGASPIDDDCGSIERLWTCQVVEDGELA